MRPVTLEQVRQTIADISYILEKFADLSNPAVDRERGRLLELLDDLRSAEERSLLLGGPVYLAPGDGRGELPPIKMAPFLLRQP